MQKIMNNEVEKMENIVETKKDFVALVEVVGSNLNGDPDNDNEPRMDLDGRGQVTDVCIKHKIREYIQDVIGDEVGYAMYNERNRGLEPRQKAALEKAKGLFGNKKEDKIAMVRKAVNLMCETFYDVRAFGFAPTTLKSIANVDSVTGPVQFVISKSVDPINVQSFTITRCSPEKEDYGTDIGIKGRKHVIDYAVFRIEGHVNVKRAEENGFTERDLEIFWDALLNMFEVDYSAARAGISTRKIYVFDHENKFGNARWCQLRDKLHIDKKEGVTYPTCWNDYEITVDEMPKGVTLRVIE